MAQLLRLLAYTRPYARAFVWLSLGSLIAILGGVLQPWPMKLLVDNVLGTTPVPQLASDLFGSAVASKQGLLMLVVAGGFALFVFNAAIEIVTTWGWTVVGRRMTYDIAQRLLASLQTRSLAYHARLGVGETMVRVTGDCWTVYKLFTALIFEPAHALITLVIMIALMLWLDPFLMMVAVIAAPAIVAASTAAGKLMRGAAEEQRGLQGRIKSHVQQVLTGITVVQSFNQEAREERRFREFATASIRAQQKSALFGGLNGLSSGLAATIGNGVVLWLGALQVIGGAITLGELLLFLSYLGSMQTQVRVFASVYPALQSLHAGMTRLDDVLHTSPDVSDRPGAVALDHVEGRVRFENVSFSYAPDRLILREVSLDVPAGETIALVGATGAGKSTLVSLIPRFSDPEGGRVLLDGHDVRDLQLRSLRSKVGLVLQEPFLFPMSVADNIAYGWPDAPRADIEAAARAANAHDFIVRLPEGYETVIGERGATLSGGERQRLSIARAILKDAPILILDEPTSALDASTEALIMDAVRKLVKGRTTFIIAHRLATVRHADRIVVLEAGAIVESGTHDQLVRKNGTYAHYVRLQFGGSESAA